ncbi:MAG: DUF423 domain-containing protein [Deltaproteobacteria bacterium]|nr:DUF423 domain-containing protein [Deltaproteobacteria bacterium]
MDRIFIGIASVAGFLGVAAGAFGAHALKARLDPDLMAAYQTGVQYQLVHAVALLGVAWLTSRPDPGLSVLAGWMFTGGIVLFSFSLYALALTGVRPLGMITPVGGVAFLVGWGCLACTALRP